MLLTKGIKVLGSLPDPWSIQSQIIGHIDSVRYWFHLMECVLYPNRKWLAIPVLFVLALHW